MQCSKMILDLNIVFGFILEDGIGKKIDIRGVHCWVCDERARKMTADQRKAIVSYMEVIKVVLLLIPREVKALREK